MLEHDGHRYPVEHRQGRWGLRHSEHAEAYAPIYIRWAALPVTVRRRCA
ncbi:hypothetical protein G3435_19260 [Pseudomonas sp. MAFF212428]|uniref:Uncharacterized protein n=1 Tax=Pseudomonas brassicae TaxID=2708063 RepID=A0A6B3NSQ5_9PSED|nr:hypothetical protein [Pseudomonas brassicae]NER63310.1 hypothetical protein [Pseudomonas brassicae]